MPAPAPLDPPGDAPPARTGPPGGPRRRALRRLRAVGLAAALMLAVPQAAGAAPPAAAPPGATRAPAAVVLPVPAVGPAATGTITVDGASGGRVFDGIGAASGGGGNSRLLYDYPEPQRSEILDLLFEPGYGASLQILKVEVGGDTNSTDGAEPSAEHTATDVDWNRGYEWWLMEQAKARNPDIRLYALAWGAPGWIGSSWSTAMIDYYVRWIEHARSDHGLTIDFVGGWNEHQDVDKAWYQEFHAALAAHGLPTRIVGADDGGADWTVADKTAADPAFAAAVDVIGIHYPCGYLTAQTDCRPPNGNALAGGKPVWASESGSHDHQDGVALIRGTNRAYLDARMTSYINWPLVAAVHQSLPFSTDGLLLANQPWSGNYTVGRNLWATAHTTRFTRAGWQYLDTGSGYLGGDRANGSHVSLKSPDGSAWTTVVETTTATSARSTGFRVRGGLPDAKVHVWASKLDSTDPAQWMTRQPDLSPTAGAFSLTLQPGYAYTLTSTEPDALGSPSPVPARHAMPLPYTDDFERYPAGREARYLSDMQGAFETAPCAGGRPGSCLRQAAPTRPIEWSRADCEPFALIGDPGWGDYTVSLDALLPQGGGVELLGRATRQSKGAPGHQAGYYLRVSDTGAWSVTRNSATDAEAVATLLSGTTAPPGSTSWHTVSLGFQGSTITAALDGAVLGTVADSTYSVGLAGLGTTGYQPAQFDDLAVTGSGAGDTSTLVGVGSDRCADAAALGSADGTAVQLWTCNGGANQRVTLAPDAALTVYGKCLVPAGRGAAAGTPVVLGACNGGADQRWTLNGDGTIVGARSGLCLSVAGARRDDGAPLELGVCTGDDSRHWTRV
ncbi:ricin-type beta-trefoil lectin domain protein [Kitasatospora herbaricolor]|uniref:ricin-type beta-trefoil lectin domain protein n=1 Tax=Kitasatospora herbaricolor TaxID=68217 RepID=UPI001E2FD0FE|nr:ricin-type beta-trefoil lectin domain protein [Kitasatospora herbaricolor]